MIFRAKSDTFLATFKKKYYICSMKAAVFKCWGLRAWPACSFPPRLHMHPGLSVKTVRLQPQLCLSGETLVSQQRDVNVSAVRHPSLIAETRLSRPWDARLSSLRHLHSPHFLHLISWICGRLVGICHENSRKLTKTSRKYHTKYNLAVCWYTVALLVLVIFVIFLFGKI